EQTVLGKALDHLRAQARELGEGSLPPGALLFEKPPLFLHLALALDVDVKPGQLRREPGILALLADGERELVVRHDHEHRARLPGSRAAALTCTIPSAISGISASKRRTRKPASARERRICGPLAVFFTSWT